MKKIRICIYQDFPGAVINKNKISAMRTFRPHFICFGEYFFSSKRTKHFSQTEHIRDMQIKRICTISSSVDCTVIGGTMPEINGNRIYNRSYIFDKGKLLGFYDKINLFQRENGIVTPGSDYKVFTSGSITFGVMVCADVLTDEGFLFMKEKSARIIFAPTLSPKKNETIDEKYARDEKIYVRGSRLSGAIIVKSCTSPEHKDDQIQARSLIASENGIIFRVTPEQESEAMLIMQEIEI